MTTAPIIEHATEPSRPEIVAEPAQTPPPTERVTAPITARKFCLRHKKPQPEPCAVCALRNTPKPAQAPPTSQDSQEVRTTAQIVDEVLARVKRTYSKHETLAALRTGLAETRALPKKRGRKPKYANDEERKAADATRKREDRKQDAEDKRLEQLADRTGTDFKTGPQDALIISVSGGYNTKKIDTIVGKQDISRLSSPNADASDELTTPDRKVTAVPVNPDNAEDFQETENRFMRKAGAALRRWAKGPVKKACVSEHAAFAEKLKDSRRKVYCGKCRKLLVNPGKPVKGISIRDAAGNIVPISSGNFPDAQAGVNKSNVEARQVADTQEDTSEAA
jgi:hypothetical protein